LWRSHGHLLVEISPGRKAWRSTWIEKSI
jgi:hypothetical protein